MYIKFKSRKKERTAEHISTRPYSPWQNGVVERSHKIDNELFYSKRRFKNEILVQGGAVEAGQRPLVLGEVGGHPVQNDANPGLVELVHQIAEVVRGAEARRGRVVTRHLVAPRAAEGVLRHGHELHVGEAHLLDVGDSS